MAPLVEHMTFDVGVVGLSPTYGIEITFKKSFLKKRKEKLEDVQRQARIPRGTLAAWTVCSRCYFSDLCLWETGDRSGGLHVPRPFPSLLLPARVL